MGMQQTNKVKEANLFQEKLEEQDAFDESSDLNEREHTDKVFEFLYKTSINTCQESATKIFGIFVDQKPQRQSNSSTA